MTVQWDRTKALAAIKLATGINPQEDGGLEIELRKIQDRIFPLLNDRSKIGDIAKYYLIMKTYELSETLKNL